MSMFIKSCPGNSQCVNVILLFRLTLYFLKLKDYVGKTNKIHERNYIRLNKEIVHCLTFAAQKSFHCSHENEFLLFTF